MEGIVSSIRHAPSGGDTYTIMGKKAGDRVLVGPCSLKLKLYDNVEVIPAGEPGKAPGFTVKSVSGGTRRQYEIARGRMVDAVVSRAACAPKIGIKEFDDFINSSKKELKNAAKRFASSLISGSPIVVRFHNDGDGASGAIALFRSLASVQERMFTGSPGIVWKANKSVSYPSSSHWADMLFFNSFESAEAPLVAIIDFGTTTESNSSIEDPKGIEFVWLDHHPIPGKFPAGKLQFYINPWLRGADSNITAGAMACSFSALFHDPGARELSYVSLISDHSDYAPSDREAQEKALVLDFITSKKFRDDDAIPPSLLPGSMDAILKDDSKLKEIFRSASEQLDEALKVGVKKAKHYGSAFGVKILALNFVHVSALDYEILPGRYSSKLHDEFSRILEEDVVLVVYYANNISIRMNKKVAGKIDILGIIDRLAENHDYVVNGGGHREAASVRIEYGRMDEALGDLLRELGA